MANRYVYLKIVDQNPGFSQQCLISYHGNELPLGVQGGRIESSLESANVYYDWGVTNETLNDCLLKICSLLEKNTPNITNVRVLDKRNITLGNKNRITKADAIITYNIITDTDSIAY